MNSDERKLSGVRIFEPRVFVDPRGRFYETWNEHTLRECGLEETFVQDNVSTSVRGVLRGLHYQLPHPQGKLVTVLEGSVFDVVVDLRAGSPTFRQWEGVQLNSDTPRLLWVPPGFAHGFLTLSERAVFLYKCTEFYAPGCEQTLRWNDEELAIEWPIPAGMSLVVSEKDALGKHLAECPIFE